MKPRTNHFTNPMNMKYPITILFLLLSFSIFSQREIIYDLNSYKQVVFKRSALVLSPAGGISGSDEINVEGTDANFIFRIGTEVYHTKDINSADEQYTLRQRVRVNIAEGVEIKANREVTKRSYTANKYLKLGYFSEGSFDNRRNQKFDLETEFKSLKFEGDFGLGFGRLEFVNHAWSAVQILQALENKGLLLKLPSHDEITKFADFIGKVRTNRILDFRLRNIEILETTINYLIEEKIIDQLSTLAILIIGDTYQYDQIIDRNTGSRLEFTFAPGAMFVNENIPTSVPSKTFTLQTIGRIDHVSYNNIDINWIKTRSYGAILEFYNNYIYYDNIQIKDITRKRARARLTYNYGYRYIPNLRNNFNLNLKSSVYMDAIFPENASTIFSTASLTARLNTTFNHYFSPSTQLSVSGGLSYNDFDFQSGDYQPSINGNLEFEITHAIF